MSCDLDWKDDVPVMGEEEKFLVQNIRSTDLDKIKVVPFSSVYANFNFSLQFMRNNKLQ